MQKLHVEHPIRYGREAKIVHGALYCVLGDTLAAQLLGGFKEGVDSGISSSTLRPVTPYFLDQYLLPPLFKPSN
jgi:hypothetical protein